MVSIKLSKPPWPKIKTWQDRCKSDYADGEVVTYYKVELKMMEEIDDLRKEITRLRRIIGRK